MLQTLSHSVLALIYPQECLCCHGEVESPDDGIACSGCWTKTRIFDGSETLCTKCGAFLFVGGVSANDLQCRKCEEHSYDRAFSVGIYEHALSASIIHLKRNPSISKRIRQLLSRSLDRISTSGPPVVIPVPLSARRQQERGFNQAALIAKVIARSGNLVVDENSLVRKIHTPMHRAGMDRKARAMTVKKAFDVVRPKLIEGRDILLVDDVLTSGETASICAKVLKESGAATVNILTIARAA